MFAGYSSSDFEVIPVPILTRLNAARLDGPDPIAASLRPLLSGSLAARALERQAEIRAAVRACRPAPLPAVALRPLPRSRGWRRSLAQTLLALVARLAPDVLSPDCL
jgi:hypothetical protein